MKRGYDRTERVADLIQKTLASILMHSMDDERFRLVTIVSVVVSKDLAYAKIYVSVLLDDKDAIQQVIAALNKSAKSFRHQLANKVELRIAPELKFLFDESIMHGLHISNLIDSAMNKTKK